MAVRIIKPRSGLVPIDFNELWGYRELLCFLTWRNVAVRYKQTVIGVAWAIIRPVLTMLVFTVIFGKVAKLPSDGTPYALLAIAGTVPWLFFSSSLTESSNSLVANAGMISKIYFPRLIMPAAAVLSSTVDFMISFGILIGMLAWYHVVPTSAIFALPLFFLLALGSALGTSLWLAALNVEYRDVRHVVPFLVQMGLYVSPVGFSSSIVPAQWRLAYCLNPMASVIDGFRWSLLGAKVPLYMPGLVLSSLVVVVILVGGLYYFRRMERTFADII